MSGRVWRFIGWGGGQHGWYAGRTEMGTIYPTATFWVSRWFRTRREAREWARRLT